MAHYNGGNRGNRRPGDNQEKGSNANAAPASVIGEPFHNPYTFIPFPKNVDRYLPTPLSADERPHEQHRRSGVLEITIRTLSPLLSCNPEPETDPNDHKHYRALTIGDDVIVPATGVRGALRTLMTVISGGTLGYLDEALWLTQGRDAQLGPSETNESVPNRAFLAEVVSSGSSTQSGTIQLGKTKLIRADDLKKKIKNIDSLRPTNRRKPPPTYRDSEGEWKVKLSGRPIQRRGKKEGLFKPDGERIELPPRLWSDYQGRHRHAVVKQLQRGDLIWLEPENLDCEEITCAGDIQSLQWARWGRHGKKLIERLPKAVIPDCMRADRAVDIVTDMFGQVHLTDKMMTFAGRIRPGNLVFRDTASTELKEETLAPLANPHPGCIAFYYDCDNLDEINASSRLKGYKVYRNTVERGENAPWKYSVQGVYAEQGRLKMPQEQRVNKTAELLNEGCTGTLRIAFRSLSEEELSLLLAALTVDWKLGGGKPLGLGHCRVTSVTLVKEDGSRTSPMAPDVDETGNLQLSEARSSLVAPFKDRIELYRASQVPVQRLRYPRAVTQNKNRSNRAGLSWFTRHAAPKKTGRGLETIWTGGKLKAKVNNSQITAQALPRLDADNPKADKLYGYDMVELDVDTSKRNLKIVRRLETFDPEQHAKSSEQAGENTSQSRRTRQMQRDARTADFGDQTDDESPGHRTSRE